MLMARRYKHRKQHRPNRSGAAKGGTRLAFGDFGIQAIEGHYVTNRQIESARIAMTRHIKRGGKVWIYKGEVAGTRAERQAQAAARAGVPGRSGRPSRGGERPSRGTRPTRADRTGGSEAAPAAAEAAPAAASTEAAPAAPTTGTEA